MNQRVKVDESILAEELILRTHYCFNCWLWQVKSSQVRAVLPPACGAGRTFFVGIPQKVAMIHFVPWHVLLAEPTCWDSSGAANSDSTYSKAPCCVTLTFSGQMGLISHPQRPDKLLFKTRSVFDHRFKLIAEIKWVFTGWLQFGCAACPHNQ